jgi:hypothetical protein
MNCQLLVQKWKFLKLLLSPKVSKEKQKVIDKLNEIRNDVLKMEPVLEPRAVFILKIPVLGQVVVL